MSDKPHRFGASAEQRRRNRLAGVFFVILIAALIATAIGAAYL